MHIRSKSLTRARSHMTTTCNAARLHVTYTESHASKLRQELKGLPICGVLRTSPSKVSAAAPKNSRSTHNGMKSLIRSAPPSPQREIEIKVPKGHDELTNIARTVSLCSNLKEKAERVKDTCATASIAFGTSFMQGRTKSPNALRRSVTSTERTFAKNFIDKKYKTVKHYYPKSSCAVPEPSNGYGAPLVTPMNKRLTIMRGVEHSSFNISTRVTLSRSRSPSYTKKDKLSPTRLANKSLTSSNISPTRRASHSSSLRRSEANETRTEIKQFLLTPPYAAKSPKTVVALSKCESQSPTRPSRQFDCKTEKPSSPTRMQWKIVCPVVNETNRMQNSILSGNKTRAKTIQAREPKRISFPEKQDIQNEGPQSPTKSKQGFNRAKPNSGILNNSFKPQLEDIQSSVILTNDNNQEHKNKTTENNDVSKPTVLTPKEIKRRKQLLEIRNKFKSKKFLDDSRYEKLEGLNWISWK